MTDDRFDRDIAARLRVYESRLPDQPAPTPGSRRPRSRRRPMLFAAGSAALAAVLVLFIVQSWERPEIGEASQPPTLATSIRPAPTTAPSSAGVTGPSVAPSSAPPTPSPTARPATTDLEWTIMAPFPAEADGPSMIQHLVSIGGAYVAVGVAYAEPLPNVGPTPPHKLLLWWSFDGHTWDAIDPGAAFDNVEFASIVEQEDGQLLAIGSRSSIGSIGYVESSAPAAWTSPDGRTWTEVDSGLPDGVRKVVRGSRGFVALVSADSEGTYELWHSADAETWTLAHTQSATRIDVGAGDEGFVAVGTTGTAREEPFAIASGDGREWIAAGSPPPTFLPLVAAIGSDWIAMNALEGEATMRSGETWASANGLDWGPHGDAALATIGADGGQCTEYPRALLSAGPWLVASTDLSYPCSEGGFAVHARQLLSVDGATWSVLPFDVGTRGESRSGASISAAVQADGALLLGGELHGMAMLWFGARP